MMKIRRSNERGFASHGWLKSFHTFSFADYRDLNHMNFGPLRVINEDFIEGGRGFDPHPHRDMEIITYIIKGAIRHEDSMGNNAMIHPGEVQRMTAGTGVVHSEYNAVADGETHLLQIWIMPDKKGIPPAYGQKSFAKELENQATVLVVSKDGRNGSVSINQDADLYISRLKPKNLHKFEVRSGRGVWLQMVKGKVSLLGEDLQEGDGAALTDIHTLEITGREESEFLLFDLGAM